jgi:hypothetical protein
LINFSGTKEEVSKLGLEFEEYYEEIYCELLGYSKETLKEWKQKRVI